VNCSESRTETNIIDRPQTNFEQIERHGVLHHQIGFFFYENSRVKLHSGDRQRVINTLSKCFSFDTDVAADYSWCAFLGCIIIFI